MKKLKFRHTIPIEEETLAKGLKSISKYFKKLAKKEKKKEKKDKYIRKLDKGEIHIEIIASQK